MTAVAQKALVTVGIPVLNRPHRVEPVLASLLATEATEWGGVLPVFLLSPDDRSEREAVEASGAPHQVMDFASGPGDYARKHNRAFATCKTEWYFLGADDIQFDPWWLAAVIAHHGRYQGCVVGTNDLGNSRVMSGVHSTHTLVHRDYLECGTIDEHDKILHEGYGHWFVDDEFVQTAQWRGTYTHAPNAIVEHFHPHWNKAAVDETYRKGQASLWGDQTLYNSRKHLWGQR